MNKVNQIFNDFKLIETKFDTIDAYDDDYGDFVQDVNWTQLVKEFSSKLNISLTYSLRKEKHSTKVQYSLTFKHMNNPPEWPYYADDCTVSLIKIE